MNLLLVTGYTTADWHRAEALFDWHRKLHNQMPTGHVLLAAASDAHAEIRTKLKIAAELAFESVHEFQVPALPATEPPTNPKWHLFNETAMHIGRSVRWPWLWLEPDCVPLKEGWLTHLEIAYDDQPARYMGPHLKLDKSEVTVLPRVSVYPASAVNDLTAKRDLILMSTKTRLIQYGMFGDNDTLAKVREDAVLFHSCKTDALIDRLDERPKQNGKKLIGTTEDFKSMRNTGPVKPQKVSK